MKKGFTLVELLAVIIILGILSIITIPPVMKSLDEARTNAYEQTISNIEQQTQLYIRENKDYIAGIDTVGNTVTIKLQDLVSAGYLKTPITDPRIDKEISLETTISIVVKLRSKYTVTVGTIIYVGV